MIDIERMADLFDIALVHHHQPVGQRHGLHLIMGDEDGGGGKALVQLADFGAHGDTQLGVEVGERLVEQEDLRFADDRAGHGDALALATGKGGRLTLQKIGKADDLRGFFDAAQALGLGDTGDFQRITDIAGDRHMRIKRIILEHHGAAAFTRLEPVDDAPANGDFT